MRLFTALWPPTDAVADLVAALDVPGWPPAGWRAIPARRWHLTLCFHGQARPEQLAGRLDAAAGRPAPLLRLAGVVSFPGVVAAGVQTADPLWLGGLVEAAGGDPAGYRPHLTVARVTRGHRRRAGAAAGEGPAGPAGGSRAGPGVGRGVGGAVPDPWEPLARCAGGWWRPDELALVHSEQLDGERRYTVLHRVVLGHPAGPGTDVM